MKKKGFIIASLLILSLSVVFMGCPPEDPATDPAELSDAAKAALAALEYTATLPVPAGTTFDDFANITGEDGNGISLIWKDATEEEYTAYITNFRGDIEYDGTNYKTLNSSHLMTGFSGLVGLVGEEGAGEHYGKDVVAGSIVLDIFKQ